MQGLNLVEELLKTYMTMIAFIQEMRKYTAFDWKKAVFKIYKLNLITFRA